MTIVKREIRVCVCACVRVCCSSAGSDQQYSRGLSSLSLASALKRREREKWLTVHGPMCWPDVGVFFRRTLPARVQMPAEIPRTSSRHFSLSLRLLLPGRNENRRGCSLGRCHARSQINDGECRTSGKPDARRLAFRATFCVRRPMCAVSAVVKRHERRPRAGIRVSAFGGFSEVADCGRGDNGRLARIAERPAARSRFAAAFY